MGWLSVLFCNCCAPGCDCGCVEDCSLTNHREAARTRDIPPDSGGDIPPGFVDGNNVLNELNGFLTETSDTPPEDTH